MLRTAIWNKYWHIIILSTLFAISVLLRFSSFGLDPMASAGGSYYHRFNNNEVWSHNKLVFDVYENYPFSVHRFAPYFGNDDRYVPHKKDPTLTVYTSFPSTHFVVPYLLFKVTGAPLTFTSLQLFGLALQATCVGMLYYLVWLLTRNKLVAVASASVYIFATPTLHHHMNVYWAHQLLMPVFLGALVLFARGHGILRWWQALILGLSMAIITWTGAVAAVGFALYGAFKFYRTRRAAYLNHLWMLVGIGIALTYIFVQILVVTGLSLPEYAQKIANRVHARSAGVMYTSPAVLGWHLMSDLMTNYGGYALIAYTLSVMQRFHGVNWGVLFVASFPLLETFILLEHDTVYGFGLLKWLVPIVLILGFTGNRYVTTKRRKIIFVRAITAANILHAALFLIVYQKV